MKGIYTLIFFAGIGLAIHGIYEFDYRAGYIALGAFLAFCGISLYTSAKEQERATGEEEKGIAERKNRGIH